MVIAIAMAHPCATILVFAFIGSVGVWKKLLSSATKLASIYEDDKQDSPPTRDPSSLRRYNLFRGHYGAHGTEIGTVTPVFFSASTSCSKLAGGVTKGSRPSV